MSESSSPQRFPVYVAICFVVATGPDLAAWLRELALSTLEQQQNRIQVQQTEMATETDGRSLLSPRPSTQP